MELSLPKTDGFVMRLSSALGVRLVLWMVLGSLHFSGMFRDLDQVTPAGDGHHFYHHEDMARRTMLEYGEAPMWDPYSCGGIPGLANPQNTGISPDMALRLVFGTGPGRRLAVFLFFFLGLEGMFHLGRFYGMTVLGSVFAAIVFNMCGRFSTMIAVGWLNMLTFYLLPAIVLSFERGLRSWGWRIFGGAMLGWTILCAGTYPFPYALTVLGLLTAIRTAEAFLYRSDSGTLSPVAPVVTLASMIGISILISAVRFLPLSMIVFGKPRLTHPGKPSYDAPEMFLHLLTGVSNTRFSDRDSYIGPVALVLSVLSWHKKAHRARLMAVVFFLLACGNFAPWAPFTWLSKLPVFNQLRESQRYLLIVIFYLAIAGGYGLMVLERVLSTIVKAHYRPARKRHLRLMRALAAITGWAMATGAIVLVAHQMIENNGIHRKLVYLEPAPLEDSKRDFKQARGNFRVPHYFGALNLGNLSCNVPTRFTRSKAVRADLESEEYPLDPSVASVERSDWAPNTIVLKVRADTETRILVNQNFHSYWSSDVGEVVDHKNALAVDLPKGEWTVTLKYRDPYFYIGAVITLISVLAALAFYAGMAMRSLRSKRGLWNDLPWVEHQG